MTESGHSRGEFVKAGYLIKSPPLSRALVSQWHRRWFLLMDSRLVYPLAERYVRLVYYQSEADAKRLADPKGIMEAKPACPAFWGAFQLCEMLIEWCEHNAICIEQRLSGTNEWKVVAPPPIWPASVIQCQPAALCIAIIFCAHTKKVLYCMGDLSGVQATLQQWETRGQKQQLLTLYPPPPRYILEVETVVV